MAFFILFEAYRRFREPPEVASGPMMAVAAVGLVVNLVGIGLLRRISGDSLNMKGAYLEVVSDLLRSVGVLVAGVVMLTTGWVYAYPLFSVVIGLFILHRTWGLMKQAVTCCWRRPRPTSTWPKSKRRCWASKAWRRSMTCTPGRLHRASTP